MKIIAPSVLASDFSNLTQQIRYVEMGGADWIHCDIMDGKFVPNITFGPIIVNAINGITNLPLDVHLMIEDPDKYIPDFIKSGADIITVHQEEVKHLNRTVALIKDLGAKAGVAINPATPVSTLTEIIEYVDMILIMSVNPGFGGQSFIENSLNKISELKNIRDEKGLKFIIQVDGGINKSNIRQISERGCDAFVAGSSIFKSDNITGATIELKNIVTSLEV
jgi:ribulose-phosphate 3-epimerase